MAEKKYNPIDLDSNVAVGIKLPMLPGAGNSFQLNYTTLDQAKSNLKNLIFTNQGERVMQPKFGCNLRRLLFENDGNIVSQKIEENIRQQVGIWLPYVNIKKLTAIPNDEGDLINVSILFSLTYDNTTTEVLNFKIAP